MCSGFTISFSWCAKNFASVASALTGGVLQSRGQRQGNGSRRTSVSISPMRRWPGNRRTEELSGGPGCWQSSNSSGKASCPSKAHRAERETAPDRACFTGSNETWKWLFSSRCPAVRIPEWEETCVLMGAQVETTRILFCESNF